MSATHAILVLIIRLWAAGIIISGITSLSFFLYSTLDNTQNYIAPILNYGVWFLSGVTVWISAPLLSRLAYPVRSENVIKVDINADQLVAIGSFLIGAFYLAKFGPQLLIDLGWWFVHLAGQDPIEDGQLGTLRRYAIEWRSTLSNLLIITVASWMAFRPAHIAKFCSWLRSAGQRQPEIESKEIPD